MFYVLRLSKLPVTVRGLKKKSRVCGPQIDSKERNYLPDGASVAAATLAPRATRHQSSSRPIFPDLRNLSKFHLNLLSEEAIAVSLSRPFHILIILSVNKCRRRALLRRFFLVSKHDLAFYHCYLIQRMFRLLHWSSHGSFQKLH